MIIYSLSELTLNFLYILHRLVSMVIVITELLAEQLCNQGSIPGMGRHFILNHSVLTGARPLLLAEVSAAHFGVKWPQHEADHSFQRCIIMIRLFIKHRDNFYSILIFIKFIYIPC